MRVLFWCTHSSDCLKDCRWEQLGQKSSCHHLHQTLLEESWSSRSTDTGLQAHKRDKLQPEMARPTSSRDNQMAKTKHKSPTWPKTTLPTDARQGIPLLHFWLKLYVPLGWWFSPCSPEVSGWPTSLLFPWSYRPLQLLQITLNSSIEYPMPRPMIDC